MIDLTAILQALIGLVAALVTAYVIPWIKAKTTTEQRAMLLGVTRTLVYAAEQLYGPGAGAEKLEYVRARLVARGFDIDAAAIEAAVREMSWGSIMVGESLEPADEE